MAYSTKSLVLCRKARLEIKKKYKNKEKNKFRNSTHGWIDVFHHLSEQYL